LNLFKLIFHFLYSTKLTFKWQIVTKKTKSSNIHKSVKSKNGAMDICGNDFILK